MNLQQIEYLVELDKYRNFSLAAKNLFITQPALTIQIKNLEQELGVAIFDRNKQPITPTEIGEQLIEHARFLLRDTEKLKDIVSEFKADIAGELKIGIIPTVAPYIVPKFVNNFMLKYPNVNLIFSEVISEDILIQLKYGTLDAGILVTPFPMENTITFPLYYEQFFTYVSKEHPSINKESIATSELELQDLWLLEEGNCFRNQIINICTKGVEYNGEGKFKYESLSIDSLMKIVDSSKGITVIPEFAKELLSKEKMNMVKPFSNYQPIREVSLVIERTFLKRTLIEKLKEEIKNSVPVRMLKPDGELVSTII
ncbi:MAG: LysR family transcriptional regulator [Bacteroidetes bacterium]|nr:LysR family transcriptional regulator [Bacteroidota bacterium]MBU1115672.1 LysR family transcriptional regulator [Bacteroidota bacterium]MBU1799015.1 LysR family transcriptional regulator [Bacteroidota bacterium]